MAKLKSIFGKGTGSIGSVTLQVNKGQQIAKSKITNMTNPRTRAQMIQRLRWANVVLMWKLSILSFLKGFFFKKQTWSWFNAFVSVNVKAPAIYLPKNYVQRNAEVLAPYYVSDGNLPTISASFSYVSSDSTYYVRLDTVLKSGLGQDSKVKEVTAELIAKDPNMQEGDALCFIALIQTFDDKGYPHIRLRRNKFILSLTDERTIGAIGFWINQITESGSTTTRLVFEATREDEICAYTIVHSRAKDNGIDVSRQQLILTDDWYENFTSEEALDRAIQTYNGDVEEVFYEPAHIGGGENEPIVPEPTD